MLLLQVKVGERVCFQGPDGKDLGYIKFVEHRQQPIGSISLGFEIPRDITILREKLLAPQGGKGDGEQI